MPYRFPRWAGPFVWCAGVGSVHVALPLAVSRRGRRRGWRAGRPGPVNLVGLPALLAGAGLVSWALAGHYRAAPGKSWAVGSPVPEYLLTGGPYRITRNPMYVGGMTLWAGWAAFLGSAPVARGLPALATGMRLAVAWEEGAMARRWGDDWRAYASSTSRWLRLPGRGGPPRSLNPGA